MSVPRRYLVIKGSGDHLSNGGEIAGTIVGAYDCACYTSLAFEGGYVLVIREFDEDPKSRETVAMFKRGVKIWEEVR
jgi:hypothetical protein